jgi:hypothetical protein
MFSAKRTANPESLRQLNLLKLRQIRVLRKEIIDEENAEQNFFKSQEYSASSVAELDTARRQCHRMEEELGQKEFYLKVCIYAFSFKTQIGNIFAHRSSGWRPSSSA